MYCEIGVQDALHCYDKIPWNGRCIKLKRGSRRIESITISEGITSYLEGYVVIGLDQKVNADHRGHVIYLNLEENV